ncbi:hypothetical protein AAHE18_07G020200 [Arachis hypogaea]
MAYQYQYHKHLVCCGIIRHSNNQWEETSALLHFKTELITDTAFYEYDRDYADLCPHVYPKMSTWGNGTNCCSWMGVTCHSLSGHVIGLDLSCSGVVGNIHPNSTLFHLIHLQTLSLAYNYIYGDVPFQISHLYKLQSLDLSWNHELEWKESTWKRMLQNATALSEIVLDKTDMTLIGPTPNPFSLIANLSSTLVTLSLDDTSINGLSYTKIRGYLTNDILCLPNLQKLILKSNKLSVHLFELSCTTFLSILDLSDCGIQGPISSSFSNLTYLTSLNLMRNQLNGSIPSSLLNLHHLTHLDLSWNEISGQIPNVFDRLTNLQTLSLSAFLNLSNNHLEGSIPRGGQFDTFSNNSYEENLGLSGLPLSVQCNNDVPQQQCPSSELILSENELSVHLSELSCIASLSMLDLSGCGIQGPISSSFSNLTYLTSLNLMGNQLNSSIPSSLLNLQRLTHLDLSMNELSGQIPNVFDRLTNLQTLFLNNNNFQGKLPSSLFTLTQLSQLDCSSNQIEGPLPKQVAFSNLIELFLEDNLLNGTIPASILSLKSLRVLELSNNRFIGHISSEITSYSLEYLFLCGNKLQEKILESIFHFVNLTFLCLSSDNWSGTVHFQLFSKLQKLEYLSLSGCNSLLLESETSMNYTFLNLYALQLFSNNIIGKVPKWIHDIPSLFHLKLSHNMFTSIGHQFPWYQFQYLDLSFNLMDDDISSFFCNASFLKVINLSHNRFTGTFPQCLANCSYLTDLDLQMNNLHDTLPDIFKHLDQLETLNLNGNQFKGLLPKSLSNSINLVDLDLGNNQFEDTFPNWLQNLSTLEILVLRGNKLCGSLPKAYIQNFQAMKIVGDEVQRRLGDYIDTSAGVIVGNILPEYDNSVIATVKGTNTPFAKIPTTFVNIDLSENKFEGEIPDDFGELHGLIGLNLSHNRLVGNIPHSLGNLTNLESLDLSSNMLTGDIPTELANLNFLEVLNLSQNQLVGPIPRGKQFDTFSNNSYEGNMGLCGLPLSVQCNNNVPLQQYPPSSEAEDKFGFGWKPVAIGYACGMVLGIGLGFYVFSIGKPQWLVIMFGGKRIKRRRRGNRRARTT